MKNSIRYPVYTIMILIVLAAIVTVNADSNKCVDESCIEEKSFEEYNTNNINNANNEQFDVEAEVVNICKDSDGLNFNKQGITKSSSEIFIDYCENGSVVEYYCDEDKIKLTKFVCACVDGACVEKEDNTPEQEPQSNETEIEPYQNENDLGKETMFGYAVLNIFSGNQRIAELKGSNNIKYMHFDHLGSIILVTDDLGNPTWHSIYNPFGTLASSSGSPKYKFTGKEQDTTKLHYFGTRYYDNNIARFTTPDPVNGNLNDPQTLNPYSYVKNNPLKYVDPDGKQNLHYKDVEIPQIGYFDYNKYSSVWYPVITVDNMLIGTTNLVFLGLSLPDIGQAALGFDKSSRTANKAVLYQLKLIGAPRDMALKALEFSRNVAANKWNVVNKISEKAIKYKRLIVSPYEDFKLVLPEDFEMEKVKILFKAGNKLTERNWNSVLNEEVRPMNLPYYYIAEPDKTRIDFPYIISPTITIDSPNFYNTFPSELYGER